MPFNGSIRLLVQLSVSSDVEPFNGFDCTPCGMLINLRLVQRFLMISLRPRLDPLLDLGQLEDPPHQRHELGRVLFPVVGDPVAQHVHGVRHTDRKFLCTKVIGMSKLQQ